MMRTRDRGSATLEIAILGPALLLLIFSIVQTGLWFYARSLALAAAQEGVTSARSYTASGPGPALDAGTARAENFLNRNAGDSLLDPLVTGNGSAAQVEIVVTGHSLSVLPGLPGFTVRQVATGPVERFTTEAAP